MAQGRTFNRTSRYGLQIDINQDFRCAHCGMLVPTTFAVAGVRNRNHCPYCLHSRHMDWREAGDRLSACRAPMRPVGLTTKERRNKYARDRDGELMLLHECTRCGALDINRVAADDDSVLLLEAFEASQKWALDHADALRAAGITLVDDLELVERRLGIGELV